MLNTLLPQFLDFAPFILCPHQLRYLVLCVRLRSLVHIADATKDLVFGRWTCGDLLSHWRSSIQVIQDVGVLRPRVEHRIRLIDRSCL